MRKRTKKTTEFLNVDLDIYSKSDLTPLVRALAGKVLVLYLGRERRLFSAHLELSRFPKSADEAILGLVSPIGSLPRSARKLWNTAISRSFNIGIQSRDVSACYEIALAQQTVRGIAAVKGQIAVTIYGQNLEERYIRKSRAVLKPRPREVIC